MVSDTKAAKFDFDHAVLDAIDLHRFDAWVDPLNAPYFHLPSGQEHYRLLAFLAGCFEGSVFLDIGTFTGASALALGDNPSNLVYSYDLVDHKRFAVPMPNIEFRIGNILDEPELDLMLSLTSMIMFDCNHDGIFERAFYRRLRESSFTGCLILDDIHLNEAMQKFWAEIELPKNDITEFGHVTGTGLVVFGPSE